MLQKPISVGLFFDVFLSCEVPNFFHRMHSMQSK
jgi:hypothetical protein